LLKENRIPCWPGFGDGTPGGVQDGKPIKGNWPEMKMNAGCNAILILSSGGNLFEKVMANGVRLMA